VPKTGSPRRGLSLNSPTSRPPTLESHEMGALAASNSSTAQAWLRLRYSLCHDLHFLLAWVRPVQVLPTPCAGRFVIAAKLAFVLSQFHGEENRVIKEKARATGDRQGYAYWRAAAARSHNCA
jgi:hypothetical protein